MDEFKKHVETWNEVLCMNPVMQAAQEADKKIVHELNKMVYELAEQLNMTIWSLVAMYIPEVVPSDPKFENDKSACQVTIDYCVKLKPYIFYGTDRDSPELHGEEGESGDKYL